MSNLYNKPKANPSTQFSTLQPTINSQQQFFKFGQERERIKSYVQQQLDGEAVKNNQRILIQFQQDAQQRRHHYLTKNTHLQQKQNTTFIPYPFNPEQSIPTNLVSYKSRFVNYLPAESRLPNFHSPPLIPTQKTKPPAYNYYNVLPYRSFELSPNIHHKSAAESSRIDPYNTPQKYQRKPLEHSRAKSLDIDSYSKENHRSWALKKIKEAAVKRRNNQNSDKRASKCSSGSSVLSELQRRQMESKKECERLGRELKKLKKYRKFIASQQNKRRVL